MRALGANVGTPTQEMPPLLTRNQYLLKASNTILDF